MNSDFAEQLSFFDLTNPLEQRIVNTGSIVHRSPFRYPGGKTWLVPRARKWLESLSERPSMLIEPFMGGGIIGLTAAFENLAQQILFVELDEQIAAVWKTIIENNEAVWLANQIESFEMAPENVNNLLAKTNVSLKEYAFQTIIKNRINRGGILASGAGRIKYGEKGRGINSRWYPETLKKRILDIDFIKERLTFIHGDGIEFIKQYSATEDVVFFIDPPYTASEKKPGSRLYDYCELNHEALFKLLAEVEGDFLMTYDNHWHIQALVKHYNFDFEVIAMKNTHHAKLTELLIGKNLGWIRR